MLRLSAALAALLPFATPQAAAQGADRWAAHETEARASLPAAQGETKVTGATLSCEAQRWRLDLALSEGTRPAAGGAVIEVDRRAFEVEVAAAADGGLTLALPRAAIEPLKDGIRMRLDFAGALDEAVGDAAFALRGSRIAITAAQERCSLRDMSAYTPVTFTPFTSYMKLARELRKDDIAGFRLSTASEPTLVAAMAEFDGGRRVLFTRLCGSSWYYGASGCNITGFAPEADGPDADGKGWRAVYDTENVNLHTDPKAVTDGWPDIVTLPARAQGPGLVWRWDGNAYALKGELPEEPEAEAGEETAAQE
ncbi:MAG: hypothetical protein M9895_06155 [Aquamicrobium sp.]|uniref:hypothetical protein n=1 Tax=Aquamicrobium sp. TaxID=1872579 RepID=UPI00349E948F|nr:hypothetical protein [Aquamicrobium sp.]